LLLPFYFPVNQSGLLLLLLLVPLSSFIVIHPSQARSTDSLQNGISGIQNIQLYHDHHDQLRGSPRKEVLNQSTGMLIAVPHAKQDQGPKLSCPLSNHGSYIVT
jgi:hypothetical protein